MTRVIAGTLRFSFDMLLVQKRAGELLVFDAGLIAWHRRLWSGCQ